MTEIERQVPKAAEGETETRAAGEPGAPSGSSSAAREAEWGGGDVSADAPNAPDFQLSAIPAEELERLRDDIVGALKTVYDPEIPADIYELGLIYKVDVDDSRHVHVDMTLTAPGCPVAGEMPIWVENAISSVPGVSGATAKMVFDPPWTPDRMSEEAKVAIGWW